MSGNIRPLNNNTAPPPSREGVNSGKTSVKYTAQQAAALSSSSVQDVLNKAQNDYKKGAKDQLANDVKDAYQKFQAQEGAQGTGLSLSEFETFATNSAAKTEDQKTLSAVFGSVNTTLQESASAAQAQVQADRKPSA